MSNYLVTGAAGFIGSRVSDLLVQQGHGVFGVDNLNPSYDIRMKEYRLGKLREYPGFQFLRLDITNSQELEALPGFDAVIHLAGRTGVRDSVTTPRAYLDANIGGTLNVLDFCRQRGIAKFILASTSSVYGANAPYPTPETAASDRTLQPYAASKKAAEVLSHSYHSLYGIDVTVLRYFTVYGPAGRPDMSMFRFTKWICEGEPVRVNGDGEQSRGFTYVDDIARGTIAAIPLKGFEVINLGGQEVITINALIAMLEHLLGRKGKVAHFPPNQAEMITNCADISRAVELLGWQPQIHLEEGVRRLAEWYLAERSWASGIDTGEEKSAAPIHQQAL